MPLLQHPIRVEESPRCRLVSAQPSPLPTQALPHLLSQLCTTTHMRRACCYLFLFPPSLCSYQKHHAESEAGAVTEMREKTQKCTDFRPMRLPQLLKEN